MELIEKLRAAIDEDERIALDACEGDSGEWFVGRKWNVYRADEIDPHDEMEEHQVVAFGSVKSQSEHIERQDPKRILDKVAADRELIADILAEEHADNQNSYYICPARVDQYGQYVSSNPDEHGRCSCGLAERVRRRMAILAKGYGI